MVNVSFNDFFLIWHALKNKGSRVQAVQVTEYWYCVKTVVYIYRQTFTLLYAYTPSFQYYSPNNAVTDIQ